MKPPPPLVSSSSAAEDNPQASVSSSPMYTTANVGDWPSKLRQVAVMCPAGTMPVVVKGGADKGQFLRIGRAFTGSKDKLDIVAGDDEGVGVDGGDLVLQIQDRAVSGMTASDANDWLRMCTAKGGVISLDVVSNDYLSADLRQYLAMRFPKGSDDHHLQNTIRDNVYLKTVPCTTRLPKDGELDGVDYRFLTVDEFRRLEASGLLLESGVYEGNLYGTPKPAADGAGGDGSGSAVAVTYSNDDNNNGSVVNQPSRQDIASLRRQNEIRQALTPRSDSEASSHHNFDTELKSDFESSLNFGSSKSSHKPRMVALDDQPATTSANSNGGYHLTNGGGAVLDANQTLGPLPPNWEVAYTDVGEKYFIDHNNGTTQWNDPRGDAMFFAQFDDQQLEGGGSGGSPVRSSASDGCSPLPEGWEKVIDATHGTFYVDHLNKRTQYDRPNMHVNGFASHSSAQQPVSTVDDDDQQQQTCSSDCEAVKMRRSGRSSKASRRVQRGNMFTRDPAHLRGELLTTRLTKGPRGLGFTLIGNDSGSPVEEFLQIKSIIPNGPAYQDGVLHMGDVLVYVGDHCVLGYTQDEAIQLFQSIAANEMVTLQVCRGYPLLLDPTDEIITQDAYAHSAKPPPPSAQYMNVQIVKGNEGFGFTIADGHHGQKVKKILYPARCPGLREGDVLCEINGQNVRRMSHTDIVDVLRDCPVGQQADILVQRHSTASLGRYSGQRTATQPPMVLPKPQMRHNSESQPGRPQSFHAAYEQNGGPDRRSKTPTAAFRYGEQAPSVRSAPSVKPRSKTPGGPPQQQQQQPPRPLSKPVYVNGNGTTYPTQSTSVYRQNDGIYENLPAGRRSRSPALYGGVPVTPNFVPVTAYHPANAMGYEVATVNLIRQSSGFGFRVLGGNEDNSPIAVGQIVAGGAADLDGRLRSGDEIAEIDGHVVLGGSHSEAVKCMQQAATNGHVKLVVRRPVRELPRSVSMPAHAANAANKNFSYSSYHLREQKFQYPYDVTLSRTDTEGFGFVIISSVNKNGSTIGKIIENSTAARCGRLQVGDRIIAVNGMSILGMHHGEIVNLIKDSGLAVTLTVGSPGDEPTSLNSSYAANQTPLPSTVNGGVMPATLERLTTELLDNCMKNEEIRANQEGLVLTSLASMLEALDRAGTDRYTEFEDYNNISVSDPPTPDRLYVELPKQTYFSTYVPPTHKPQTSVHDELVSVELDRGAKGFGFSIRGGQEFGAMPLYVLRIADGGPANIDGRLLVGDQLVYINGVSTVGMTHEAAIDLIKREPIVRLRVRRPSDASAMHQDPVGHENRLENGWTQEHHQVHY